LGYGWYRLDDFRFLDRALLCQNRLLFLDDLIGNFRLDRVRLGRGYRLCRRYWTRLFSDELGEPFRHLVLLFALQNRDIDERYYDSEEKTDQQRCR